MRDHDGALTFAPRLPPAWTKLRFGMGFQGRQLWVEVSQTEVTYKIVDGEPLTVRHHGQKITVKPGKGVTREIPPLIAPAPVHQPPGRPPLKPDPRPFLR
jgi:alpha,alpha-trehalose phosphorylase